ncbi:MAG: iron chelate uptake ABC transporter family permease subunit, partial [Anaerolineales bacterium]
MQSTSALVSTPDGEHAVRGQMLVPRSRRTVVLAVAALAVLALAATLGLVIGSVAVPPRAVLDLLLERLFGLAHAAVYPPAYGTILFELRLPRVVFMALTGAALAPAGAAYQGLFRNPLADPYLVGVASGAGLGATLALVFQLPGTVLGLSAVPVSA